ncbi:3199_t:CDS:2, partial [Racocetra fulgida]
HGDKKGPLVVEEKSQSNETGVDSITNALEALTINKISQKASNVTKMDKIESDIKELVK